MHYGCGFNPHSGLTGESTSDAGVRGTSHRCLCLSLKNLVDTKHGQSIWINTSPKTSSWAASTGEGADRPQSSGERSQNKDDSTSPPLNHCCWGKLRELPPSHLKLNPHTEGKECPWQGCGDTGARVHHVAVQLPCRQHGGAPKPMPSGCVIQQSPSRVDTTEEASRSSIDSVHTAQSSGGPGGHQRGR